MNFLIAECCVLMLIGFIFSIGYTINRVFKNPEFILNRVVLIERKYIGRGSREGMQYIITLKVKELNRTKNLSLVKILDVYSTSFSMAEIVAIEGYEISVDTKDLEFPNEPLSNDLNPEFLQLIVDYKNAQNQKADQPNIQDEIQQELNIDDILDKINKSGKESLSISELNFLNKISNKDGNNKEESN